MGKKEKCNKSTTSASNNVVYKLHYKLTNNIQPTCKLGRGVHNHYMISFCNVRPYVTKKFQHALPVYSPITDMLYCVTFKHYLIKISRNFSKIQTTYYYLLLAKLFSLFDTDKAMLWFLLSDLHLTEAPSSGSDVTLW